MSEAIKDWVYNIVLFLLFSSLLQQITAAKKYDKYVRFFSGLLLVLLVISPILRWIGSDKIFEFNYLEESFSQAAAYAAEEMDNIKLLQEGEVSKKYGRQIQLSLESILQSNGYELVEAEIDLEDNNESALYFYPKKIYAKITGLHNKDDIKIEPIEIGIYDDEGSSENVQQIKEQIAQFFSMGEEDVTIEIL